MSHQVRLTPEITARLNSMIDMMREPVTLATLSKHIGLDTQRTHRHICRLMRLGYKVKSDQRCFWIEGPAIKIYEPPRHQY